MDKRLKILCDAFLSEKKEIAAAFAADRALQFDFFDEQINAMCTNMVVTRASLPDRYRLWECRGLLHLRAYDISWFRGSIEPAVCCFMAASADPAVCLGRLLYVHKILLRYFDDSKYLIYSAMVLSDMPDEMIAGIAMRAAHIYELMKKCHRTLTSYEDQVLCIMFAMSGRTDEELICESEYIFGALGRNDDRDTIQSVSHILTLADGLPDAKVELLESIYDGLYELGKRYGSGSELVMLAALASVTGDVVTAVTDTADTDNYLAEHDSFIRGIFGGRTRLVYAAMLTAAAYTPTDKGLCGTLSMNAAEFALLYISDTL